MKEPRQGDEDVGTLDEFAKSRGLDSLDPRCVVLSDKLKVARKEALQEEK